MSFQAYLDDIKVKTGKTPAQIKALATKAGGYKRDMKAGELVAWLKREFDLSHVGTPWPSGPCSKTKDGSMRRSETGKASSPVFIQNRFSM